ncbi:MAG: sensor histidine kinase N-terminal domain-containing protein [Betaproteobacteria bacterium]|nr:sensor histidine kinase N-terminal domain-containing protein [Betaproteobacteria bacterium]MBI2959614.1 sensor histidine kinase N-terminal domain-containing protein [Betaproteobacteria bacterium]
MNTPATRHDRSSLRQLLTRWLSAPLIALIAASLAASYFIALFTANDAYDDALLDPALAIANHVRRNGDHLELDLPAVAIDALRVDTRDRIFYRVEDPAGQTIAGNAAIPAPPERLAPPQHVFYDAVLGEEPVRVVALFAAVEPGTVLVQVAETLVKRGTLLKEILFASAAPALALAIAALALSWFGIGRSLAPLGRLRAEIDSRSPRDLHPVSEDRIPIEVRPLVRALNHLLARLKSAIEGQQRFIANAAHQLRTPLAGLKTHAELARREPSSSQMRSLLDMVAQETERTSHLVNQLLTLARAEGGAEQEAGRQPLNLHEIATRAVHEWVPRALAKNIDLGFELEDAWTLADALLVREMLANLLDNALAYTQAGGAVTVRSRNAAGSSILEVQDNGPGIAPAERTRVFERFYRVPGSGAEGCGLGLAIVAEIAERFGARVELSTSADGRGTLIRVFFEPLAHGAPQAAQLVTPVPSAPR